MAYEAVGDYQKAYMAKKEVYNKFEEISTDVNREFVDLMSENEMENLRLTQENLLQQNSNKLTLILALILLLIIIISIAVSLWRRYNKRKQVAESLSERIETIDETHRQKEATSKRTIEERNRELAALSLRMAQVDKSVNLIAGIAKEESLSEAERISKISKLVKDIDVQENIWDMVSVAFERTRQSFFSELYRRHPDLTQGEIRMCAYMLMGMSTKEIALLTNRSSRTVDTIKYNMRKKMAITEPTESYLRRIASAE
jgi:DNA-binding CsgD family transcriptional regulator